MVEGCKRGAKTCLWSTSESGGRDVLPKRCPVNAGRNLALTFTTFGSLGVGGCNLLVHVSWSEGWLPFEWRPLSFWECPVEGRPSGAGCRSFSGERYFQTLGPALDPPPPSFQFKAKALQLFGLHRLAARSGIRAFGSTSSGRKAGAKWPLLLVGDLSLLLHGIRRPVEWCGESRQGEKHHWSNARAFSLLLRGPTAATTKEIGEGKTS